MGDFADYYNDQQDQSIDDLLDYQSGSISEHEAIERGVLNEQGELETTIDLWGVHDCESLENELNVCELIILKQDTPPPSKAKVNLDEYWITASGDIYHVSEMTTKHLENSIAFSERTGYNAPVVSKIKKELERRWNQNK